MPKAFKCSPPTDKYSISDLELFSLAIQFQIEKTAEQKLFNIIDRKLSI